MKNLLTISSIIICVLILVFLFKTDLYAQPGNTDTFLSQWCPGNIVTNGTFSTGLTSGPMPFTGHVDNWTSSYTDFPSPDVNIGMGCNDTGAVSMWGNQVVGEAIYQTLATPIIHGKTYRATICFKWGGDTTRVRHIRFKLRASNSVLTGRTGGTIIGVTPNSYNTSWVTVTLPDWIADNDYTILTIGPENNNAQEIGDSTSYGSIDNVCLQLVTKKTTGPPVSHIQRWYIPTAPNIQGLSVEETAGKLPRHVWFTQLDQEKLGRLQMPKRFDDCNFAYLNEWLLHTINDSVVARPFKIVYVDGGIALPKPYKARLHLWYTDTNRNTINGIYVNGYKTNQVYSYKIDSALGHPWDIQAQGKVKYTYADYVTQKKTVVTSNPKIWFSVHPVRNQLFALDPSTTTATLETYTIPYGNVDAFFVDQVLPNSTEFIWIAASEGNFKYYYRMTIQGGNVLMWKLTDSLSGFNSLRTLHDTKKLRTQEQLPFQLWALANTGDGIGAVRVIQFKTNVVYATTIDTLCMMPKEYYNGPNGLFAPSSKTSMKLNRMFITEGLGEKDTLSSNRSAPADTIRRMLTSIVRSTKTLQPVLKFIPITSRRVKPFCEVLNWKFSADYCIVEQWKAYEPPPSFDFSAACLDIDMVGNNALLGGKASSNIPDMERYNFAFHEPRPGNFGVIGRITYTGGLAINGTICDTCTIPRQQFDKYGNAVPERYQLFNAYPNPFNPTTTLKFALPSDSKIILKIYNMLGQEVQTLIDAEIFDAGTHETMFNAGNLASGVYYYRIIAQPIQTDGLIDAMFTDVKKMLLLK